MEKIKRLVLSRKVRFVLVGVSNTAFNFLVLNVCFYFLDQGKLSSSIIATICAVTLSFFLNRNFVFKHHRRSYRQPIMFAIITLSGVLLLQNTVYALFLFLLHDHTLWLSNAIYQVTSIRTGENFISINLSNLIASLFTMFWNYNGYRLFVFKDSEKHEQDAEAA